MIGFLYVFIGFMKVWCLDGDGSVLMHMGALSIIGNSGANNLRHVVFNNGCHDSVGGQKTVAMETGTSLATIARSSGYRHVYEASTPESLSECLVQMVSHPGPSLLEATHNPTAQQTSVHGPHHNVTTPNIS